ncbi:hypothetical protein ACFX5U_15275 [Sphingobacterium sp. SG20118]|uniref:hypothetical protein n=1 Tax=Sphingobacterium TaxID=28453 RepID=UPI0011863D81|nr:MULTISPECIES: hypothetical protein [Sphingobacterium]MDH5825872.1 hypothetical protein [Sphingobacterium faecium]
MKQLTICILLLTFLFQTFSKIGMLVDYKLNTIAYAKFCLNKDKPLMHCNGQCVLMQKLKKQAEKETKQAPVNLDQLAYIHPMDIFDFKKNKYNPQIRVPKYDLKDNMYTFQFAETIFHPPLYTA